MKKIKKPRPPSKTLLTKLYFQAVLANDGARCLRCGRTDTLAPSHIYPKGRYTRMRWLVNNSIPLCWNCHFNWWHKNPIEAGAWIKTAISKYRYDRLKEMSQNNNLPKPNPFALKKEFLRIINLTNL